MGVATDDDLGAWLAALERRHLAELTLPQVRRAVQALSSWYVERRSPRGGLRQDVALAGAGKRAAFALFYGPLHALTVRRVVRELGATQPAAGELVDLGCGTGAAAVAWALETPRATPRVLGIDRSAWAAAEARWTFRRLGLDGQARRGDLARARLPGAGAAILAAYSVNELAPHAREALLERLLDAAGRGARVLVVEPVARRLVPWWDGWAASFAAHSGRVDAWRFPVRLPELLARLDRAAGLDHRELTARSLYLSGRERRRRQFSPSTSSPCSNTTSTGMPAAASRSRSPRSSGPTDP